MQAVLLAAGMGKRLGKLTRESTKCMVTLNGRRLIEYTLDALVRVNVDRVVMVVGHGADEVKSFLGSEYKGVKIEYILNIDYSTTNNIYSLLLARKYLVADDTLLLESDLIFDESILIDCINSAHPNVAVVAKYESWMDGTVVYLNNENNVETFISKRDFNRSESHRYFKTVNVYKLSKEFCNDCFIPFLEAYVKSNGKSTYYEEVLKILAFIGSNRLKAMLIEDKPWYEIDDIQDLDVASAIFANGRNKLATFQRMHGGYWRFSKLKDYYYLVNPFFPTPRMVEEMRDAYYDLLTQYPSGQNVQNVLASTLFNCHESHIVVGNGASELIKCLMPALTGTVGIPFPTFNEYYETLSGASLAEFVPQSEDFEYSADDLLQFCCEKRVSTLILINPDNPTGHYLSKEELLYIVDELNKRNVLLILDESFVDFVDGTKECSLINDEILQQYRNLIVIKSISKSYGVPGLRLGVMATANCDLMTVARRALPIWNINSFGEHFLQIVEEYLPEYYAGCKMLVSERERIFSELKKIAGLRPIKSYANYILCGIENDRLLNVIVEGLLDKKSILIKDCSGKKGIDGRPYVRFAIRNTKDNDYLIQCLKELVR